MEKWSIIPRFPNYEASNLGRIRRINGVVLKSWQSIGYEYVGLSNKGKSKSIRVQYLVMEAFIGPKPHKHTIHHKDFNKLNNELNNLEYLSHPDHNKIHYLNTVVGRDELGRFNGLNHIANFPQGE